MMHAREETSQPAVALLADFDRGSGSFAERLLFNNRVWVVAICAVVTILLGFQTTRLHLNAGFEKMIPLEHPYIVNYLQNKQKLAGVGNAVRIAVETKQGSIFDAAYLDKLKAINDEVFLIPGVDRPYMKSLWTPSTRWIGVTEEGFDGGTVIPSNYDGTPVGVEQVRANVERSGEIGQLVAANYKSSVVFVPLLDIDTQTGKPLDYHQLAERLENLRDKYQNDDIAIHITGFAKLVGDLIDGLGKIFVFFLIAVAIAALTVFWYTRCLRSTALVVACSLVAVVWQLGLLPTLGYNLDPYSILVPFLVFAIGMSHGVQKMNGIMQDIGRGAHKLVAARYTFRRLFVAGLTALLCDAVGFAVLLVIKINVIQELAIAASIGVAVLIFTNLILLPVLLSYIGVSRDAALRSLRSERIDGAGGERHVVWRFLDRFTGRRYATFAVVVAGVLAAGGLLVSQNLRVGDLDAGAPELRPQSRYNLDNAFFTANYAASSDILIVMVATPENQCAQYRTLMKTDALEWQLRQVPGVESTSSLAALSRQMIVGMNEGSAKWYELLQNQNTLKAIPSRAPRELLNQSCDTLAVFAFLKDHKADTLAQVVSKVEEFSAANNTDDLKFLLAAGNAGIEAATNVVVKKAAREMLFLVYGAVIILCLLAFRSWRPVLAAVLPLMLTSILAEALMVWLGIGMKVATLPVIALGIGIGVDYALYVLSVVLAELRNGRTLSEAYYRALIFTGKVVLLTGIMLALGVATWALSPIKFQADMGILLAFMFLWNMLGALILLPALCYWLIPADHYRRGISRGNHKGDAAIERSMMAESVGHS
jgi:predicted RND superfamily exporter protein